DTGPALGTHDSRLDPVGEFSRRELGRVDGHDLDSARLNVRRDIHIKARGPFQDSLEPLVEGKDGGPLSTGGGGSRILDGEGGLSAAGGTEEDRAGPELDSFAHQGIQLGIAGLQEASLQALIILGGDEPRKDVEAALLDDEVVVASPIGLASELRDPDASP